MISSASAELRDPEYDMVEALDNTAVGAWRPFSMEEGNLIH